MRSRKNTVGSRSACNVHDHPTQSLGRVLAQVDAKMVKPQPERPFEGTISIHSEISPMASSDYEPGR